MTALDQYDRLESLGQWREGEGIPAREVLVSFGNATLLLSAFSNEAPLTHWSLAAVTRLSRDGDTVTYAPQGAEHETLTLSDAAMIDAIETVTVMARINATKPPRRRGPRPLVVLGLVALLGVIVLGVMRGPALTRLWALALISDEQAVVISDDLRTTLATPRCADPDGLRALGVVVRRLGLEPAQIAVYPWDAPALTALPDGTLLIARSTVEKARSADALAGWILLGQAQGPRLSPLRAWMHDQETARVIRFLTDGMIAPIEMARIADLTRAGAPAPQPRHLDQTMAGLSRLDISSDGFVSQLGAAYPQLDLPETGPPGAPLLPGDRDWVALQNICQ